MNYVSFFCNKDHQLLLKSFLADFGFGGMIETKGNKDYFTLHSTSEDSRAHFFSRLSIVINVSASFILFTFKRIFIFTNSSDKKEEIQTTGKVLTGGVIEHYKNKKFGDKKIKIETIFENIILTMLQNLELWQRDGQGLSPSPDFIPSPESFIYLNEKLHNLKNKCLFLVDEYFNKSSDKNSLKQVKEIVWKDNWF